MFRVIPDVTVSQSSLSKKRPLSTTVPSTSQASSSRSKSLFSGRCLLELMFFWDTQCFHLGSAILYDFFHALCEHVL